MLSDRTSQAKNWRVKQGAMFPQETHKAPCKTRQTKKINADGYKYQQCHINKFTIPQ